SSVDVKRISSDSVSVLARLSHRVAHARPTRSIAMQLVKFSSASTPHGVGILENSRVIPLSMTSQTLSDLLERESPASAAKGLVQAGAAPLALADVRLLAPIDRQEVWAAGVTYVRSRKARMDESVDASTFYDKVYAAPRPELFFKATPRRVSGPG